MVIYGAVPQNMPFSDLIKIKPALLFLARKSGFHSFLRAYGVTLRFPSALRGKAAAIRRKARPQRQARQAVRHRLSRYSAPAPREAFQSRDRFRKLPSPTALRPDSDPLQQP